MPNKLSLFVLVGGVAALVSCSHTSPSVHSFNSSGNAMRAPAVDATLNAADAAADLVGSLDKDRDGVLRASELSSAPLWALEADRNKDGRVTIIEMMAAYDKNAANRPQSQPRICVANFAPLDLTWQIKKAGTNAARGARELHREGREWTCVDVAERDEVYLVQIAAAKYKYDSANCYLSMKADEWIEVNLSKIDNRFIDCISRNAIGSSAGATYKEYGAFGGVPLRGKAFQTTPVANATVKVFDLDGKLVAEKRHVTDKQGAFSITIAYPLKSFRVEVGNLAADANNFDFEKDSLTVNAITTLVSAYRDGDRNLPIAEAEDRVRNFLRITEGHDIGEALQNPHQRQFDAKKFFSEANANRGLASFTRRLVKEMSADKAATHSFRFTQAQEAKWPAKQLAAAIVGKKDTKETAALVEQVWARVEELEGPLFRKEELVLEAGYAARARALHSKIEKLKTETPEFALSLIVEIRDALVLSSPSMLKVFAAYEYPASLLTKDYFEKLDNQVEYYYSAQVLALSIAKDKPSVKDVFMSAISQDAHKVDAHHPASKFLDNPAIWDGVKAGRYVGEIATGYLWITRLQPTQPLQDGVSLANVDEVKAFLARVYDVYGRSTFIGRLEAIGVPREDIDKAKLIYSCCAYGLNDKAPDELDRTGLIWFDAEKGPWTSNETAYREYRKVANEKEMGPELYSLRYLKN